MSEKILLNAKNKRIDFIVNELLVSDVPYQYSNSHAGELFSKGHGDKKLSCFGFDVGGMVKRDITPSHPFLFNLGSGFKGGDDRLFSSDKDFLITDLQAVLKGGYEYVMMCDSKIKWIKFEKCETRNYKNVSTVPFSDTYEVHYRERSILSGETEYIRDFFSVRNNKSLPIKFGNLVYSELVSDENHLMQAMLTASAKEDAYRLGVFHVKITNKNYGTGVTLYVEPYEVMDLMRFREPFDFWW